MAEAPPSERPITPAVAPRDPRERARHRTLVKLGGIAALALCLLGPLALLLPVVQDRAALRDAAVNEIHRDWGRAQTIVGPILVLPLRKGGAAYALPDELHVVGELVPETRSRGIYDAIVFTTKLAMSGTFHRPDPTELGLAADDILWDRATVAIAISDLRGVADEVALHWGDTVRVLRPGSGLERWSSGMHVSVAAPTAPLRFTLDIPLRGSSGIRVAPLGVRNHVALRSTWASPKFAGAFLPTARDVGKSGFDASWSVSHYGRDFAQQGTGPLPAASVEDSLFGVELLAGIDSYRSVERAIKYGVLFVILAFASFFVFEIVARVRIHPLQYAMVGLALGVFFLLLLSLSELVPFGAAYAAAAASTIGLVATYMVPVLKTGRRTIVAVALFGASFTILYVVLAAEDYALLAGALVVFAALAAVMRVIRRVDWYAEDAAVSPTQPPPAVTP